MDRNDFLRLTGWTEQRLKNNISRNNLPFFGRPLGSKWQRHDYSGRHAVLIVVAEELTRGNGLSWEMAAKILRGAEGASRGREVAIFEGKFMVTVPGDAPGETRSRMAGTQALVPTDDTSKDVWIGVAEHPRLTEPRFVLGKLTDIVSDVNQGLANLEDGPVFSRIFLANLTDAIRRVEARAADFGIDLNNV